LDDGAGPCRVVHQPHGAVVDAGERHIVGGGKLGVAARRGQHDLVTDGQQPARQCHERLDITSRAQRQHQNLHGSLQPRITGTLTADQASRHTEPQQYSSGRSKAGRVTARPWAARSGR
jgi:hypothetical protein